MTALNPRDLTTGNLSLDFAALLRLQNDAVRDAIAEILRLRDQRADLLAALTNLLAAYDTADLDNDAASAAARAAISKATGE